MCTPSKPFAEESKKEEHDINKNKILDLAH
jgi:hypothetical protein